MPLLNQRWIYQVPAKIREVSENKRSFCRCKPMTLLTSMNFSNICPPLPYYWSPTIYRSSVFLKTRPGHSPLALAVGFLRHAPISRNLAIPSLVAIMTFDQFFYVTNLARYTMSTRSHGRQPLSIKQAPRVHVDQPCHLMHCLRYLRLQHQVSISVRQACENQPVRTYRPRLGHPFWRSYALHCTNSPNRPFSQVALGESSSLAALHQLAQPAFRYTLLASICGELLQIFPTLDPGVSQPGLMIQYSTTRMCYFVQLSRLSNDTVDGLQIKTFGWTGLNPCLHHTRCLGFETYTQTCADANSVNTCS